jgi:transcriptional regulator with XRE-family HTH domain
MDTVKLANYIENLRYKRKLKQEEFIDGVTSFRQYQRYRSGESQMPISIIYKFAKKLNINPKKLLIEYDQKMIKESKEVETFFNHVIRKQIVEANHLQARYSKYRFIDESNENFYKVIKYLLEFYSGTHTRFFMIDQIKELINYPRIIKDQLINDWELFGLGILLEHSERDASEILDKLISLESENMLYASSQSLFSNLQIYFWLVKNLGKQKSYKKVIYFSTKAIEICHNHYSFYSIHQFYYFRGLARYRLNMKEYKKDLKKIYYFTKVFHHIDVKFYSYLFKKDLNMDLEKMMND